MKKLIALMFLGLMTVSVLSGCQKSGTDAPTETPAPTEPAPPAAE